MPGPLAGFEMVREMNPKEVKIAYYGSHTYWSIHTKCTNGANCTGPGCRVSTGKTRRNG